MSDQPGVIYCSYGCCPGCQDCYGMSIGCHQDPCRCDRVCICTFDADGSRRLGGCERHDDHGDLRHAVYSQDPEPPVDDDLAGHLGSPCPECGATGACAYDSEGRALIHPQNEEMADG